ncbi:MAG: nucleoside triphosphate pyrophosphatase [Alphaproteobacteria bacterium]
MNHGAPKLILASGSATRATMLRNAGLIFDVVPAAVDEDEMKRALRAEKASGAQLAEALAELKAQHVARKAPQAAMVIGADQVLECGGQWFDKPQDVSAARAQLLELRGKSHRLISSACVVRDGQVLWMRTEHATLLVRNFSDAFVDDYLARVGDAVTRSVGAYQLEGIGAQLFARIDGDYFTILGLPLLPLLEFLRAHKRVLA